MATDITGAREAPAFSSRDDTGLLATLRHQWQLWRKKPIGLAALIFVLTLLLFGIFGPLLVTHDPLSVNLRAVLHAPSSEHWFGTDSSGRDVYSRLVAGARISITIGFAAVAFGISLGSLVGMMSGYFGGWLDYGVQRITDAIMAIPGLILLLALVAVLEPSITNLIIALVIVVLPTISRVVRGEVLVAKQYDYVLAARALGAGSGRIVLRHILPNIIAPILILASVLPGAAILIEASLSFLGLGVPPPAPTWGSMLSGSNVQYMQNAPWLMIFPGLAITLTVLAFNMLGDALRDIFDPRQRGSR